MQRSNFSLTPAEKADAREALRILAGSGISLADAARRACEGRRALKRITVAEAADIFLRTRLAEERRAATVEWYEVRLKQVVDEFGSAFMDTVTRPQIRTWLDELATGGGAKAANARAARALWRWALKQEPPLAASDITIGLKFAHAPREGAQPVVLTPEECERILRGAGRHRSAVALMMFAGVRPSEVCGKGKSWLRWEHVSAEEKWVRIPADIAKVAGRARILEGLPPALWRWLEVPSLSEGEPLGAKPIAFTHARSVVACAQRCAGFTGERKWEADALRHTFASYALALTDDPGKVSLWLGHEQDPTMLHRHYRGLVTKAQAKLFWALKPSAIEHL